jgi:hypothetical protein
MKLVKRENDYCLYNESGETIAASWANVTGKKLLQSNCDEIFGVVDVEKLAEKEYPTFNLELNLTTSFNTLAQVPFINGFNKAIELNKDKVFSKEDMAYIMNIMSIHDISFEDAIIKFQLLQQPTEIEVEIEMECKIGCDNFIFNGDKSICCGNKIKKLDSNGNLILRKL